MSGLPPRPRNCSRRRCCVGFSIATKILQIKLLGMAKTRNMYLSGVVPTIQTMKYRIAPGVLFRTRLWNQSLATCIAMWVMSGRRSSMRASITMPVRTCSFVVSTSGSRCRRSTRRAAGSPARGSSAGNDDPGIARDARVPDSERNESGVAAVVAPIPDSRRPSRASGRRSYRCRTPSALRPRRGCRAPPCSARSSICRRAA